MAFKKFLIFILALLGFFILPNLALAAGDKITPLLCNLAKEIYAAAIAAIIICWVVVTILFLTSFGSPERANLAKKAVWVAIIGTVIILFGSGSLKLIEKTLGVLRVGGDVCDVGGVGNGGGPSCDPPCNPSEECIDGKCIYQKKRPPGR